MRHKGRPIHGKRVSSLYFTGYLLTSFDQIRGEFMRASRILSTRPERAIIALAQLCEERKETQPAQTSPPPAIFIPPRLSSIPPQTPYTVGSNSGPKGLPSPDRIAPEPQLSEPAHQISTLQ